MEKMEEVYRQYFDDVFRYLRGISGDEKLAEELTEETFFKALKGIKTFRGDCDIRVWLCQIAKNTYFSYWKKSKREETIEGKEDFLPTEKNMEQLLVEKEMAFSLHEILHEIAEPYKEVFSLRVFGELSFKKIGLLFGKSEHWACVTYHRAKSKIQKGMEERR